MSGTFRGDGQVRSEGCLACPAFPTQDCECFHFYLRLCEVASVHTFTCASVLLCRCDVLHMEVKTLDVGGSFRYVVGSLLFVVLCCEQREFRVAGRAALVVEDGQDLTACYAIEPASVNISSCYRLWHVCLLCLKQDLQRSVFSAIVESELETLLQTTTNYS